MDALSAALSTVRLTGAIIFNAEFTAPWGFAAPPVSEMAPMLAPKTDHLVVYHLVTEGRALACAKGVDDLLLTAGDIVIIPQGDPHSVSNGSPSTLIDTAGSIAKYLLGDLSTTYYGGGGETTRFVCGFFGCERHASRLLLTGLPPLFKINVREDAAGAWLEHSIRHLVTETASKSPGSTILLSKMAEALFIEGLRRYMAQLPPGQRGWLAGARDPLVGSALALLHGDCGAPWTLARLAGAVGTSRSILAARFAYYLDEPPMSYLARWRLQRAACLLQTTRWRVIQVAGEIGYESEAAFNRAFKRAFGCPPAAYRRAFLSREDGKSEEHPLEIAIAGQTQAPQDRRAPRANRRQG